MELVLVPILVWVREGGGDNFQVLEFDALKCFHDCRCQGNGSVVAEAGDGLGLGNRDDDGFFEALGY